MAQDADWKMGTHWVLKATFYSDSVVDRTMGFAGPQGGFLSIKVPAGVQAWTTRVAGPVKQPAEKLEFQHLEVQARRAWPKVSCTRELDCRADLHDGHLPHTSASCLFDPCLLARRSCEDYQCPLHSKSKGSVLGFSELRCCEKKLCQDEKVTCPKGKYTPHECLGVVSIPDSSMIWAHPSAVSQELHQRQAGL